MKIEVYTDGSATTADKPGGWGYVILVDGVKHSEASGGLQKATNNVAEITAAIEGLRAASLLQANANGNARTDGVNDVSIELISDSQLVLRYATGEYQCRKYHLLPLYLELRKHYRSTGATTRWVRGHSGDTYNEQCDKLAKAARANVTSSGLHTINKVDEVSD